MPRVPKHMPIDYQDAVSLRSWMGRCMDMPGSFFEDDSREELRWDLAHYFWTLGCHDMSATLVHGDQLPTFHGNRKRHLEIIAEMERQFGRSDVDKKVFKAALEHLYDELNLEVVQR